MKVKKKEKRGNPKGASGEERRKGRQASRGGGGGGRRGGPPREGRRAQRGERGPAPPPPPPPNPGHEPPRKAPNPKGPPFETAIIERYRRQESSVEEALIEMYLAGVSVRRVEDITEALWGSKVSPATISELNKKAYVHIEDWRNRPLQGGRYPYVYVDGIYLRRNWGGEFENVGHSGGDCSE